MTRRRRLGLFGCALSLTAGCGSSPGTSGALDASLSDGGPSASDAAAAEGGTVGADASADGGLGALDGGSPAVDASFDSSPGAIVDSGSDATIDASPDAALDSGSDAALDARADPFAALLALPGVCTTDGWCWRTPTPVGNEYENVFSTSPDNIWLIAGGATVMQWNGSTWTFHRPPALTGQPASETPLSITGIGPNDMWLIYGSVIDHWDGIQWTTRATEPPSGNPSFNVLWESPQGDTFVTISDGTLKESQDGGPFNTAYTSPNYLGSIWGTASDDYFITTLPGGIIHYDGTSYTTTDTASDVVGAYQGTKNDVWVSGGSESLRHWDGTSWTTYPTAVTDPSVYITSVGVNAPNDVWWWSSFGGQAFHWDGASVTTLPQSPVAAGLQLNAGAIIDGKWWLVGGTGTILSRDDGTGTIVPIIDPTMDVIDMWGASASDMYFATGGPIEHWDGTTTQTIPVNAAYLGGVRNGSTDELFGMELSTTTSDDAAGETYLVIGHHFDGTIWTATPLETSPIVVGEERVFQKVYAMGPGTAMAVGTSGLAYLYSGGAWSKVDTGITTDLLGVWGPDVDHVWMAGPGGVLLKWVSSNPGVATPDLNFAAATADAGTPGGDLGPVHGAGGIMWVGDTSNVVAWKTDYSGSSWTAVPTPAVPDGLFAVSATNVVVSSGGQSRIARWNGTVFTTEDNGAWISTPVLFEPPGGPMLAGGEGLNQIIEHP